jgi:uncharacterized RDD family membrane protein YckC
MAEAAVPEAMKRRLVTPEGVDLGLSLAEGGQRISAFVIDLLIMLGILIGMSLVAAFGIAAALGRESGELAVIVWLLGFFVLRNFYFIIMEMGTRAATFGKRSAGIRVVARSGGRLTADAVIARNLMREIEFYLPLSFLGYRASEGLADTVTWLVGLGWASIFLFFPLFNKDRLRIGDLLAGTWVINAPKRRLTVDLMRAERERPPGYPFTEEQLDAYGIYELQTLERVLRDGNWEAMSTVSWTIRNKIAYGDVASDYDFLTAYYEALRLRLERKLLFGRRRANKFDR